MQGDVAASGDEHKSSREFQQRNSTRPELTSRSDSYQQQTLEVAVDTEEIPAAEVSAISDVQPAVMPGIKPNRFSEKTNLLDT